MGPPSGDRADTGRWQLHHQQACTQRHRPGYPAGTGLSEPVPVCQKRDRSMAVPSRAGRRGYAGPGAVGAGRVWEGSRAPSEGDCGGCLMTPSLTHEGYLQTKEKLALMEKRLAALRTRTDLHPTHKAEVELSYQDMMRQYLRE